MNVTVPDLGDFKDVEVIDVLVKPGDEIEPETPLITLETEKATMDVPSSAAGIVKSVAVKKGDRVSRGSLVLTLEEAAGRAKDAPGAGMAASGEDAAGRERPATGAQAAGGAAGAGAATEPAVANEAATAVVPPIGETQPAAAATAPSDASAAASGTPPAPAAHAAEVADLAARRTAPRAASYDFDVVVLGAGPGGYTAAFRAADLGMKVALIERWPQLGGVCLNVGCIPSKALLHAAKVIEEAEAMGSAGIRFGKPKIDVARLNEWKRNVVGRLTGGLATLAKQRKVEVIRGSGRFVSPHEIAVTDTGLETGSAGSPAGQPGRQDLQQQRGRRGRQSRQDNQGQNDSQGQQGSQGQNGGAPDATTRRVSFAHCIIAAGSESIRLPGLPDDPRIIDSTGALDVELPQRLLVVGGGIIGLEMVTVYEALGCKVSVAELTEGLMPGCDRDLVRPLEKRLAKRCERIMVGTRVSQVEAASDGLRVSFEGKAAVEPQTYDKVLIAVGRSPNGANLGADAAGVHVNERGYIPVDRQMRTNVPHIFAIGDVAGPPMLAHKASHEGKLAAEVAGGEKRAFDARVIPSVAYTDPEVAWVGVTETDAKARKIAYQKASFPWAASGRSLTLGRDEGLTKLLFDPATRRVIGGGIVGPNAGDLISEVALAIEMGSDAADLGLTIHPHPTLSETLMFAAEAYDGTLTDLYLPKRQGSG